MIVLICMLLDSLSMLKKYLVFSISCLLLASSMGCGITSDGKISTNPVSPKMRSRVLNAGLFRSSASVLIVPVQVPPNTGARTSVELNQSLKSAMQRDSGLEVRMLDDSNLPSDVSVADLVRKRRGVGDFDSVLVVTLKRLKEREGSRVGSESGAELGLSFQLFDSGLTNLIWEGTYFQKQVALTENLFNIGDTFTKNQAPHWDSSSDLIEKAFEAMAKDLSDLRLGLYQEVS